ncbi:MAG: prefoldin subunit alpha [Candidatus Lokiarchaeota archaeon]|nr:prefoldin subunit alpha [Candidatus Lokiarchaeota archaeon]
MENNTQTNMEQQIYQFQYLKEQRDALSQNLSLINGSLQNYMTTKATVENLKNINNDEEILLPIGGSIILNATIKNANKILTYICQDIVIEKDFEETIEFLDKIIEQHQEQIKFLSNELSRLDMTLQGMSQLIQQGYSQQGYPQQ